MSQVAAQDPALQDPQLEGAEDMIEQIGPPTLFEALFPWVVSVLLHAGVGLIFVFMVYAVQAANEKNEKDREVIVIPSAFSDPGTPGGIPNPGTGGGPQDAAQDKVKEVLKNDGWAQTESDSKTNSFLQGASAENDALFISAGSGGSVGKGGGGAGVGEGGPIAPYGVPGGGQGSGPKSSFYGTGGGNVTRIVYILDHSGSMLDYYDFLKQEANKSIGGLVPVQAFNIVMVAEEAKVLGPKADLVRATTDNRRSLLGKLNDTRAQGKNDDELSMFKEAFEQAFAMKPQLIYFLTDGRAAPEIADVVKNMNKDKRVRVMTYAFIQISPDAEDMLKKVATENGGKYRFVRESDLGR